jgi:hypothetical protein
VERLYVTSLTLIFMFFSRSASIAAPSSAPPEKGFDNPGYSEEDFLSRYKNPSHSSKLTFFV